MTQKLVIAFAAVMLLDAGAQRRGLYAPRSEQVQSDLSTREISIQSNFNRANIVLFGSIDFSRAPSPEQGAYDVIMVISGPSKPMVVRRKEQIAGLWVNGPSQTFSSVPGFYAALGVAAVPGHRLGRDPEEPQDRLQLHGSRQGRAAGVLPATGRFAQA